MTQGTHVSTSHQYYYSFLLSTHLPSSWTGWLPSTRSVRYNKKISFSKYSQILFLFQKLLEAQTLGSENLLVSRGKYSKAAMQVTDHQRRGLPCVLYFLLLYKLTTSRLKFLHFANKFYLMQCKIIVCIVRGHCAKSKYRSYFYRNHHGFHLHFYGLYFLVLVLQFPSSQ